MTGEPQLLRSQTGLSYVEVLISVIILGFSVMPINSAIQTSMQVTNADIEATSDHYRIVGLLEDVLAQPFSTVAAAAAGQTTPSIYSDPIATPNRRLVFIAQYDGDNADTDNDPFTGGDSDLLWVRVEIEGTVQSLTSLRMNQ